MFGFGKSSRMKKLWTGIGTQLSDFFSYYRRDSDEIPAELKTNSYVLGYLLRMCLYLYYDAVKGKTDVEEQGFVLANSLAIALNDDARDMSQRIQILIKNPNHDFNRGKEDAISAIEKITKGDTTAFEEFMANIYKITKQSSDAIKESEREKAASQQDTFKLMADLACSDPNPQVRTESQQGIKKLWPGGTEGFSDSISKIIAGLKSPDNKQMRHIAAVILVDMGELSIPYVRPLLEDDDPEIRQLAIRILVMIEEDQRSITKNRDKEKGKA
jgi:hypothetical protein